MSVLAIDIGNSRVGLNVFTAGKALDPAVRLGHGQIEAELAGSLRRLWEKTQRETAEAGEEGEEDEGTGVVIVSVAPALAERVEAAVQRELKVRAQVVGRDLRVPVKTMLRDETTVGQDRLAGAMAAYVNVEAACAIVQVGTALVVDCIDDEGIFRGGAIAPGLQMSAKALHDFTAQLPESSLTPPTDDVPFGRFTQEAINLGLYVGIRGAVRELLERYATALGAWPHVVATGGDALAVLGEGVAAAAGLVDSYVPDLVLQGAALVWEHGRRK